MNAGLAKSKPNIMLIEEDDEDDYIIFIDSLKSMGVEPHVYWMSDGDKAMDYLTSHKSAPDSPFWPDMILLDLNMPRKDGFEVLQEIKSDKHLRLIPVVILSTSGARDDICRAYELGVNAYMQKPLDYGRFVKSMDGMNQFWFDVAQIPSRPKTE